MSLDIAGPARSLEAKRRFRDLTSAICTLLPTEAGPILQASLKKRDAAQLAALLHQLRPKVVLEVGSYCGISTRWILSSLPDAVVECVDPWPPGGLVDSSEMFDQMVSPYRDRVIKTRGYFGCRNNQAFSVTTKNRADTCPGEYHKDLAVVLPSRRYDLVFVDGDHRTSSSINAFMLAKEHTSCLIYHDANMPTHRAAFDIIRREWAGEWTMQCFADGEDGLAVLTNIAGRADREPSIPQGRDHDAQRDPI